MCGCVCMAVFRVCGCQRRYAGSGFGASLEWWTANLLQVCKGATPALLLASHATVHSGVLTHAFAQDRTSMSATMEAVRVLAARHALCGEDALFSPLQSLAMALIPANITLKVLRAHTQRALLLPPSLCRDHRVIVRVVSRWNPQPTLAAVR